MFIFLYFALILDKTLSMRKSIFVFSLLLLASFGSNAQRMMGIATSNWSGTNGMYLNPANIADSRTKFSIDLFSVNFGIDNNNAPLSLSDAFSSTSGNSSVNSVFKFDNGKQINLMLPYAEMRLPGLMVSIDHKNSFAITFRIRAMNQFNNFAPGLITTLTDSNLSSNTNYDLVSKNFNWTLHGWAEANVSYARVLYEKDEHFLKAGLTLRYLAGLGFMSIKGSLDAHYSAADTAITANHTNIQVASNLLDNLDNAGNGNTGFDQIGKKGGHGFGADIGVVYEWRPDYDDYIDPTTKLTDHSANKYKIRASVAVTDIGAITYDNVKTSTFSGNGVMSSTDIRNNFSSFNNFKDYATSRGFTYDTSVGSLKVALPTTIVAAIDYYIGHHFYLNGTYIGNVVNRQNVGNSYYDQIILTPRFDTKFYSLGIPVSYSYLTGGIKAGFGMRMGGFFMGTDDMLAFFSGNQYGVNFYFGAYIPINKKNKSGKKDAEPTPSTK